jgi:hypothetical protein
LRWSEWPRGSAGRDSWTSQNSPAEGAARPTARITMTDRTAKVHFFSIRILDLVLFGKKVSGDKTGSQFFLVLLMGGYRLTSFSRQKIH